MANVGFNTFILGQTAATSAAATDSVPLIQGGGTRKALVSTITPYNVVGPTGGNDTAMLNAAFANAASRPVMLSFGQYDVRGPLTVPDFGVVVGAGEINLSDYWHNSQPPRINLVLNPSNSFVSGDAAVTVGNYSKVANFSILGLRNYAGHASVNGINLHNKAYTIIEDVYINLCYNGIDATSDGNFNGGSPWGNNSIGNIIRRCYMAYSEEYGFISWGPNGGFFSDSTHSEVWAAANYSGGIALGVGCGNSRVVNCRIEDQGLGLWLSAAGPIIVSGCQFDRNTQPIRLDQVSGISVTGCVSWSAGNSGSGSGGTGTHVYFTNRGASNVNFAGNSYGQGAAATSYTYGVQNSGTVAGCFAESGSGNTAQYQDAYSQSIISPLMAKMGP